MTRIYRVEITYYDNRQGGILKMSNKNKNTVRNSTQDAYHSFLESLKGKEVTIYRGGPESKSGVLLDVQSDFVTVLAQNNNNNNNKNNNQNNAQNNAQNNNNNQNNNQNQSTVVYYNISHIASISENSVNNSTLNLQQQSTETEMPEFVQSDSFTGVVEQLEGKYVQINQGGPESKKGQVLGVVEDFIVLFTEDDGVVYFNVQHIKSIAEYNQNNQNQNQNNGNAQMTQTVVPEFEQVSSFHELFGRMAHKWIAINRGGPEAMEGILVENAGGHYTLINNQEVMRINPYHIKSISSGPKGALKQQNQNNQQNQQQDQNQQQQQQQQQNTEATAESNQNNKSEDKNKSNSKNGNSRRASREKVVKTIDYVWKSN
jgi:spore coat protein B